MMARPPPPPARKRGSGPAAKAKPVETSTGLGGWEEVRPEESMWGRPEEVEDAINDGEPEIEEDEEEVANALAELKNTTMGRRFAEEDLEVHEKQVCEKNSNIDAGGFEGKAKVSFPIQRKKASGIRRKKDDD